MLTDVLSLEIRARHGAVACVVEADGTAHRLGDTVDDLSVVGIIEGKGSAAVTQGQSLEGHVGGFAGLHDEALHSTTVDDRAVPRSGAQGGPLAGTLGHVPEVDGLVVDTVANPHGVASGQHRLDLVDRQERLGFRPVATRRGGLIDPPLGGLR